MSPRAPKRCGYPGCDERVTAVTYCDTHRKQRAWQNSTGHGRTSTREWRQTRTRILERDHWICYLCGQPGADTVDHKTPVAQGGSEHDDNLGAVHDNPCHRRKTASEGHEAMRAIRAKAKHPVERDPGLTQ
jgi:5-methylcytosine-specific restriction protein A